MIAFGMLIAMLSENKEK
ncbi:hypothetical protein MOD70_13980 [Bacillus haynesii]|nr:hypothetical protein [Bacillus haynesii]